MILTRIILKINIADEIHKKLNFLNKFEPSQLYFTLKIIWVQQESDLNSIINAIHMGWVILNEDTF